MTLDIKVTLNCQDFTSQSNISPFTTLDIKVILIFFDFTC